MAVLVAASAGLQLLAGEPQPHPLPDLRRRRAWMAESPLLRAWCLAEGFGSGFKTARA